MQELDDLESIASPRPTGEAASRETLAREVARRLSDEVVSRFVLDPAAFARSAHAEPAQFVQAYRESVDKRLAAVAPTRVTGRPALATAGEQALVAIAAPPHEYTLDTVRMGVVVAFIVGSATVFIGAVMAVTAVTSAMASARRPL